jgi:cyclopropane-fatty-acyl-phospholipid synthase
MLGAQRILEVVDRKTEQAVCDLLEAGGVTIGGNRPWDVQVHDKRFFSRVLRDNSLGFGEAYMDGWWDSEQVDETCARLLASDLRRRAQQSITTIALAIRAKFVNPQSFGRASAAVHHHYDIGNDLYQQMLGETMAYTCAYWKDGDDLDQAQRNKLDLVCRKVGLEPGMTVLDLGCGWGTFARYAAENYGVHVTGYTISKEQVALGKERCAGLDVELRCEDYRDARGLFDRVVSIGIMEHVGPRNYSTYMDVVDRTLKPDGISFIHTIGGNRAKDHTDPWIDKYIFPNAVLPTMGRLTSAMHSGNGEWVIEDVHNIGPHYDPTLMAWLENFERAWPSVKDQYGERFYRMWKFYLSSCAGGFRARFMQLYQMVFTRQSTLQPDCRLS